MNRKWMFLLTLLAIGCLALLWCKADGVEVVCSKYRPEQTVIVNDVSLYPYLLPNATTRTSSRFFRYRVVWHGPHVFRVAFRDFGKQHEKVRLTSVLLSDLSGTWTKSLAIHSESQGLHPFEEQNWTKAFNEVCFYAVTNPTQVEDRITNDIELPENDRISADLKFQITEGTNTLDFKKRVDLVLKPRKTYMSHLVASIISR